MIERERGRGGEREREREGQRKIEVDRDMYIERERERKSEYGRRETAADTLEVPYLCVKLAPPYIYVSR